MYRKEQVRDIVGFEFIHRLAKYEKWGYLHSNDENLFEEQEVKQFAKLYNFRDFVRNRLMQYGAFIEICTLEDDGFDFFDKDSFLERGITLEEDLPFMKVMLNLYKNRYISLTLHREHYFPEELKAIETLAKENMAQLTLL